MRHIESDEEEIRKREDELLELRRGQLGDYRAVSTPEIVSLRGQLREAQTNHKMVTDALVEFEVMINKQKEDVEDAKRVLMHPNDFGPDRVSNASQFLGTMSKAFHQREWLSAEGQALTKKIELLQLKIQAEQKRVAREGMGHRVGAIAAEEQYLTEKKKEWDARKGFAGKAVTEAEVRYGMAKEKRREAEEVLSREGLDFPKAGDPLFAEKIRDMFPEELFGMDKNGGCGGGGGGKIEPKAYQKLVGKLCSPGSRHLRGFVAYHSVGSGKTLGAIQAILEWWRYCKAHPNDKDIAPIVVVMSPTEKIFQIWDADLAKAHVEDLDTSKIRRVGFDNPSASTARLVFPGGKFEVIIHKMTRQLPRNLASAWGGSYALPKGSLCIVDEAHNLVNPIELKSNVVGFENALQWGKSIRDAISIKLLLMTATPLLDSTRLTDLMKMVNLVQPTKTKWLSGSWSLADEAAIEKGERALRDELFVNGDWKPGMKQKFQQFISGTVSWITLKFDESVYPQLSLGPVSGVRDAYYLQDDESLVKKREEMDDEQKERVDERDFRHIKPIKVECPMGPLHYATYNRHFARAVGSEKACEDGATLGVNYRDKSCPVRVNKGIPLKTYTEGGIVEKSSKFPAFWKIYQEFPKEKHFVFTSVSQVGQGPKYFRKFMEKKGVEILDQPYFARLLKHSDPKEHFYLHNSPTHERMIYFSKNETDPEWTLDMIGVVLGIHNDERNKHGDYVRIFFGDVRSKEGLSLFCERHIHMLEPCPSLTMKEQVIGRGFRMRSHCQLPQKDWTVRVYVYVATPPPKAPNSTKKRGKKMCTADMLADQIMYEANGSDLGDLMLTAVEEASLDCLLFNKYNAPEGRVAKCFMDGGAGSNAPDGMGVCYDLESMNDRSEYTFAELSKESAMVGIPPQPNDSFTDVCKRMGRFPVRSSNYGVEDEKSLLFLRGRGINPVPRPNAIRALDEQLGSTGDRSLGSVEVLQNVVDSLGGEGSLDRDLARAVLETLRFVLEHKRRQVPPDQLEGVARKGSLEFGVLMEKKSESEMKEALKKALQILPVVSEQQQGRYWKTAEHVK